jgi:hypothetical protein
VEVVKNAGVDVVSIKNPGFIETPEVMNRVLENCETNYVIIASVSEFLPFQLLKKYAEVANTESHDVVRVYRVSITAGKEIPISGPPTSKSPGEIRFFRKGAIDYQSNQVHSRGRPVCPENRILKLTQDRSLYFFQFRDYDCSKTEIAMCRYDDLLAKQRYMSGSQFTWLDAFWKPIRCFAASYFWYGSYRYGMLGFIHSYYRWHMEFTILLRVWEWQNSFTRDDVIEKNRKIRCQMESAFITEMSSSSDSTGSCPLTFPVESGERLNSAR